MLPCKVDYMSAVLGSRGRPTACNFPATPRDRNQKCRVTVHGLRAGWEHGGGFTDSVYELLYRSTGMCVLSFFALEQSGGAEQNHRRDDEHGGYCGDGWVDLIA